MERVEVRFARVGDVLADSGGRLTELELTRNARLRHPEDRAAHLAAHLLVRRVAATLAGRTADELTVAQACTTCGGAGHGRPYLPGLPRLFVSLSHTRARVAAIAAPRPCGIDVERVRPVTDAVRRQVLTAAERLYVDKAIKPHIAFSRLWTAKEAMVKAGLGTLADAADWPASPAARQWTGGSADELHVGSWLVS